MKRHLYVDPESGSLEDCSESPYSWDSSFCVVLRGNEDLWQRYLDAEEACDKARRAVLDAATKEPMTTEEQVLHDRDDELHAQHDLESTEWMRRSDEIKAAARQLAESADGTPADPPKHEAPMTPLKSKEEAVALARAVISRSQTMDVLAKKLRDYVMHGLECSETVQLEKLAAENAAAACVLAAWVVQEHG